MQLYPFAWKTKRGGVLWAVYRQRALVLETHPQSTTIV